MNWYKINNQFDGNICKYCDKDIGTENSFKQLRHLEKHNINVEYL